MIDAACIRYLLGLLFRAEEIIGMILREIPACLTSLTAETAY
jgi:hypothetical protein